jgi:transposase
MSEPQVLVGIDVSKAHVDVALRPTEACWHTSTDALGIAGLVERWRTVQPTLVVLEATGGLEVPVTGALAAAGRPVVVNPRHARAFATATGRLAKTDRLDARGLAHVAEAVRPTPRPLPAAQAQALSAMLTRRRPLVQSSQPRVADGRGPRSGFARTARRTSPGSSAAWLAPMLTWRRRSTPARWGSRKTSCGRARRASAPSSRGRWSQRSRSWGS